VPVEKRITVNLTRRAAQALESAAERTGDSQTDVIGRALTLFDLVEGRIAAGDELILRSTDGEVTKVVML
jgi:hypothetical protein